jgi:hypothetical protein
MCIYRTSRSSYCAHIVYYAKILKLERGVFGEASVLVLSVVFHFVLCSATDTDITQRCSPSKPRKDFELTPFPL